jgi:pimeloyl-ACP methyl ester carboxylesterase
LIATREITANGLTFTCREAGTSGEPVILLHGFPETSHMWAKLMPPLVEAGYRCLAPDQRGYSPGARPGSVDQYRYEDISDDVIAAADAWGAERFHLVGHNWARCAAGPWSTGTRNASRVGRRCRYRTQRRSRCPCATTRRRSRTGSSCNSS